VAEYYPDGTYQRDQGFRLLAIDGSKIRLPDSREIQEVCGTIKTTIIGQPAQGLASVGYEVLNRMVIDRQLGGAQAYSVPRRQRSPTQRLNYHRRIKKSCF